MPRYFLHLPEHSDPLPWDPRGGPRPERADTRFFGQVFIAMEALLDDPEIDVYLTFDVEALPSYGDRVVAVVLGDEAARIPRYVHRVKATFKCYGIRPAWDPGLLRAPSMTALLSVAQIGVRWLRWIPGAITYARADIARRGTAASARPILKTIPIGTFNQLDLPILPIADRTTDISFAGSVEHKSSFRQLLGTPKSRVRKDMLAAARELSTQRPNLSVDLGVTASFLDSMAMSPESYSHALMDSKICLAPRGTSAETFRIFEGMRYGCIVVSDRLPKRWFFAGAPIIEVDRWRDLESVAMPILEDPDRLTAWHERTLSWWRDRCAEPAVGRRIAETLNSA